MRTDFAILETRRIAGRMGAVLPEDLVVIKGRVRTPITNSGGGVLIGCAHQPRRHPHDFTVNEERLQSALLEPRTAKPLPLLQRIAGAVCRWC